MRTIITNKELKELNKITFTSLQYRDDILHWFRDKHNIHCEFRFNMSGKLIKKSENLFVCPRNNYFLVVKETAGDKHTLNWLLSDDEKNYKTYESCQKAAILFCCKFILNGRKK